MAKLVGLDFETETAEDGNMRLLLCAMYSDDWWDTFDLRLQEDYKRLYYTLLIGGHKYIVFNASFDIEIIIIILLKNGFTFLKDKEEPKHGTMKLIMGQKIYTLVTYYELDGKLIRSQFIDLANIIVGASLESVAEKFTNLEKGDYEASKKDWEEFKRYCLLDAQIAYEAYITISEILDMEPITIGTAAFQTMLKMNFNGKSNGGRFRQFKAIFGDLTVEEDVHLRKWYAGGLGWSSSDDRVEVKVNSYDLNSAYPAVSLGTLPTYKRHLKVKGYSPPTEKYPFAFIRMRVTGQIKEGRVPVLPSRNIYGDSNIYIYDDKEVCIIQEYNKKSEYEYWMDNMEIDDLIYLDTILMREATLNPLRSYMEKYRDIRSKTTGIENELAKLMMNSITGKLGSNPIKDNVYYKLNDDNKLVKAGSYEVETDTFATHTIAVITSRVRCQCYAVDEIIRDKTTFRMYATDSVKYSSESGQLIETGNKLGDWAIEHENTDFIFLGLKAYIFDANNEQGKREVMCAGISRKYKDKITNEQFFAKTMVPSLVSVRTGNGRIIYEGQKRIASPVKKDRRRRK